MLWELALLLSLQSIQASFVVAVTADVKMVERCTLSCSIPPKVSTKEIGGSHLVQLGAKDVCRVGEDLQHDLHRRHGDVLLAEFQTSGAEGGGGEGIHHVPLHLPHFVRHLLLQLPLDQMLGPLEMLMLKAGHLVQGLGVGGARGQGAGPEGRDS